MLAEPAFADIAVPENQRLAAAWSSWRTGPNLPRRSDIRLQDLKAMLDKVSLVEVAGPDDMRIRVAGTGLREYLGFELTGTSYRDITPPDLWPTRRFRVLAMIEQPCGGLSLFGERFVSGRNATIELLSLPIAHDHSGRGQFIIAHAGLRETPSDLVATPDNRRMRLADTFRYLDIGNGTPARDSPA